MMKKKNPLMKPLSVRKNDSSFELAHGLLNTTTITKEKEVSSTALCKKFLITIIDRSFENLVAKYSKDYTMQLPLWLLEIYDKVNRVSTTESINTAAKIEKFAVLSRELYNRIFVIMGEKIAEKLFVDAAKLYMDELEQADMNLLFLFGDKKVNKR
jgi:hypothetical protein